MHKMKTIKIIEVKEQKGSDKTQKQYENEKMETGRVDFSVYTFYIKSMGIRFFGSSIIFMIIYQVSTICKHQKDLR